MNVNGPYSCKADGFNSDYVTDTITADLNKSWRQLSSRKWRITQEPEEPVDLWFANWGKMVFIYHYHQL